MVGLALLLIGYSLFSASQLAVTHFRSQYYAEQVFSRWMGLVLLAVLCGVQLAHFVWLYGDVPWVNSLGYRQALFVVAPAFYLFSQPILTPTGTQVLSPPKLLLHGLPLLACLFIPAQIALPAAFLVGAGYLVWLGCRLYMLRRERARFRVEMLLLSGVFAVAIGVSVLGFVQALLPAKLFFSLYASAIGLAFFGVQLALGVRPALALDVSETAQAASYVNSTLGQVDCEVALERLRNAVAQERIYRDPNLSLAALALHLGLSSHQVSELLNSRLGKSFSRFVREARVAAAKTMLQAEPTASVLSVGLSVGFTSQSTFYDAFKEIEGMTPGQYRKLPGAT